MCGNMCKSCCGDEPVCSCSAPRDTCSQLFVKALVEFFGTFILVHTVCMAFNQVTASASPALASGLCLVFLVYSFGHVSGGHFNPAVSTGVWIGGGMEVVTWALYIFAQFAGGIAGGCVAAKVAVNGPFPLYTSEGHEEGLWMEFLFTFLMVTCFLNCSLTGQGSYRENSFFGLAIGFVFIVAMFNQTYVYAGTPGASFFTLSSGALNPALFIGADIGSVIFADRDLWTVLKDVFSRRFEILFLLMEFVAAVAAGFFFVMTEQCVVAHKGYNSSDTETGPTEETELKPVENPKVGGGYRQGNEAVGSAYANANQHQVVQGGYINAHHQIVPCSELENANGYVMSAPRVVKTVPRGGNVEMTY